MSRASVEAYSVHRFMHGVREAWTALEHGESAAGLRDRLTTLTRQLKDITPTLETRGHRELLRDLSAAVERVDEGSGVHAMPIAEIRYDFEEYHPGWDLETNDAYGKWALGVMSRSGIEDGITHFRNMRRRFQINDGPEGGWIARES